KLAEEAPLVLRHLDVVEVCALRRPEVDAGAGHVRQRLDRGIEQRELAGDEAGDRVEVDRRARSRRGGPRGRRVREGPAVGGGAGGGACWSGRLGRSGAGAVGWLGGACAAPPARGGSWSTAAGSASRSICADATRPATTGTYDGALLTTRPARFSVVTAYWPG